VTHRSGEGHRRHRPRHARERVCWSLFTVGRRGSILRSLQPAAPLPPPRFSSCTPERESHESIASGPWSLCTRLPTALTAMECEHARWRTHARCRQVVCHNV
jgi:hypothetical protein